VVVDMLNSYEHEDAERLTESVETIVEPVSELIARAERDGVELIYMTPLEAQRWRMTVSTLPVFALMRTTTSLLNVPWRFPGRESETIQYGLAVIPCRSSRICVRFGVKST
jgi:hypothetical protein